WNGAGTGPRPAARGFAASQFVDEAALLRRKSSDEARLLRLRAEGSLPFRLFFQLCELFFQERHFRLCLLRSPIGLLELASCLVEFTLKVCWQRKELALIPVASPAVHQANLHLQLRNRVAALCVRLN